MAQPSREQQWQALQNDIANCRTCPRLVEWRESIAQEKVKRFSDETYWGRAVPSFGTVSAKVLIAGLAPAAHGANRTGRMFTGDRSGLWLYRALHKAGLATQSTYEYANDGQELIDTVITAICHCAPPANKPAADEVNACKPFLLREKELLSDLRVIVALGKLAFDNVIKHWGVEQSENKTVSRAKPKFGHCSTVKLSGGITLIGSYHPSQQNTFTKRLTEPMFDEIFEQVLLLIDRK